MGGSVDVRQPGRAVLRSRGSQVRAVAAGHALEHGHAEPPRQAAVDRHEDDEEEAVLERPRRSGRLERAVGGHPLLRGNEQVVLGVGTGARPRSARRYAPSRLRAFWAASAIGSLSAPIGGE